MARILIFANGHLPNLDSARAFIQADDFIIAADGGTQHVLDLGLFPHLVIGDLDSLDSPAKFLMDQGVQVVQFPRDKNETDLELAIEHAMTLNPTSLIILAALGGRLDQTLANFSLIADPKFTSLDIRVDDGVEEAFFCRNRVSVKGRGGDLVSLIPWGAEVRGVVTENLKWPLFAETLFAHKTRGISNEMVGEIATVKIISGLLLIVHRRKTY
jgi:thiamine pyrophosphokinase